MSSCVYFSFCMFASCTYSFWEFYCFHVVFLMNSQNLKHEFKTWTYKDLQFIFTENTRILKTSRSRRQTCKMENKHKHSKFMKIWNFPQKSLINGQKAHTKRKSLTKQENIHRWWTIWEKKKLSERKAKVQPKSFYMVSSVQNTKNTS